MKKKYSTVSRPPRAENSLILYHTEVFEADIVLKTMPLNYIVDLPDTVR